MGDNPLFFRGDNTLRTPPHPHDDKPQPWSQGGGQQLWSRVDRQHTRSDQDRPQPWLQVDRPQQQGDRSQPWSKGDRPQVWSQGDRPLPRPSDQRQQWSNDYSPPPNQQDIRPQPWSQGVRPQQWSQDDYSSSRPGDQQPPLQHPANSIANLTTSSLRSLLNTIQASSSSQPATPAPPPPPKISGLIPPRPGATIIDIRHDPGIFPSRGVDIDLRGRSRPVDKASVVAGQFKGPDPYKDPFLKHIEYSSSRDIERPKKDYDPSLPASPYNQEELHKTPQSSSGRFVDTRPPSQKRKTRERSYSPHQRSQERPLSPKLRYGERHPSQQRHIDGLHPLHQMIGKKPLSPQRRVEFRSTSPIARNSKRSHSPEMPRPPIGRNSDISPQIKQENPSLPPPRRYAEKPRTPPARHQERPLSPKDCISIYNQRPLTTSLRLTGKDDDPAASYRDWQTAGKKVDLKPLQKDGYDRESGRIEIPKPAIR